MIEKILSQDSKFLGELKKTATAGYNLLSPIENEQ